MHEAIIYFDMSLKEDDIGCAILLSQPDKQELFAFYIKNRRTRSYGSVYSVFKEKYRVITRGFDDAFGIPIPPRTKKENRELFVELGRSVEEAEAYWEQTRSLVRRITSFDTLANKSINRQRRVPPKLRMQVLARDGFRCILCGRTSEEVALHVDHITPVSKGGSNEVDYLATLCKDCNLGKGSRSFADIFSEL